MEWQSCPQGDTRGDLEWHCHLSNPATPSPAQIHPFRGFPSPKKRRPCRCSPWVGQCQAGQGATSPSQTPARRPPRARPPGASQTTEPNPIQRPPKPHRGPPSAATTGFFIFLIFLNYFFPVSLPHQGRVWGGPGDATRPRQPCGGSDVGAIPKSSSPIEPRSLRNGPGMWGPPAAAPPSPPLFNILRKLK